MEDSGIDSDSTKPHSKICYSQLEHQICVKSDDEDSATYVRPSLMAKESTEQIEKCAENSLPKTHPRLMSTIQLQRRLERQIQEAKKIRQQAKSDALEPQKCSLIPRNRLPVPNKSSILTVVTKADEQPLVSWESDSDEEITNQLKKDGYNLDSTPDDEDLDLIPPTPLNKRCSCCFFTHSCSLM